jgi:hypothetical protein
MDASFPFVFPSYSINIDVSQSPCTRRKQRLPCILTLSISTSHREEGPGHENRFA